MFLVSCSLERSQPTDGNIDDSIITTLPNSTSSGEFGSLLDDSICAVVADTSGWFDMYCGGNLMGKLHDESSEQGKSGLCSIVANTSGYDVYCGGVKQGELHNGKDGVSCNAFQDNITEEISVSCGDTLIGILHNGKDGKKGEKGDKGEMGAGCELRDNAKGDGYDVYCGDSKQGELHNGKTGATGEQGKTGESCSAESSNGDVKITCGKNTVTLQKGEAGKDGESCTIEPASSSGSSGYNVTCNGETKFIHDGKDGKDGAGCYVTPFSSSGSIIGYDIFCGSSSSAGRITNGEKGEDGQKGEDGAGCSLINNETFVTITCGDKSTDIPKDPTKSKFCVGENGLKEPYDEKTQMCDPLDGQVYMLCIGDENGNRNTYDEKTQLCDTRDGQLYNIVTIGTQTWMAQNLNYNDTTANANSSLAHSYCYEHSSNNCTKYGRLYQWDAAVNACPSGWHLPTKEEWMMLFNSVSGNSTELKEDCSPIPGTENVGTALKSTSGWYGNGNGTDEYGFSVLPVAPASTMWGSIGFSDTSNETYIWSKSYYKNFIGDHVYFDFNANETSVTACSYDNSHYLPVRCLKD